MADTNETNSKNKAYRWLNLPNDFFARKEIKSLRHITEGDTCTVIYLKMLLRSLKDNGRLYFEGYESDFASEVALDIDEDVENVKVTIQFLLKNNLIVVCSDDEYELVVAKEMIGQIAASTIRSNKCRERKRKMVSSEIQSTTYARQHRERGDRESPSPTSSEENRHIPYIEDYTNAKRYNGNYYLVLKRDRCQCVMCGKTEYLCVHHIDGYDKNNPANSEANKMVTLCRSCHSQVHRSGLRIPKDTLDAIGYNKDSSIS